MKPFLITPSSVSAQEEVFPFDLRRGTILSGEAEDKSLLRLAWGSTGSSLQAGERGIIGRLACLLEGSWVRDY